MTAAGRNFRFGPAVLIDPSPEFIAAFYCMHSGVQLEQYGLTTPAGVEAKAMFKTHLSRLMQGELIQSPIFAVIVEAEAASLDILVKDLKGIAGVTNPIGAIREGKIPQAVLEQQIRHHLIVDGRRRIAPLPDSDGEAYSLTKLHTPDEAEANFQLRLCFRQEDLEPYYDQETITEILGPTPVTLDREAVTLADLLKQSPAAAAKDLKGKFKTLANTTKYDVQLLVRELAALLPMIQRSEAGLASALGLPYDHVPLVLPEEAAQKTGIFVLVGVRASGKTKAADILSSQGKINALISPYAFMGESSGPDKPVIPEADFLELLGQRYFVSAEVGPGALYCYAESSMRNFARFHGGRALVLGGIGHAIDLER
ncbi:MAG TPA: hypothetical protein VMT55_01530, partial [Candidatus Sulfotelmatobacter sp.]|nr:hypothetical protein [Candidatus Sulfotelmatobacter sp.]